MEKKLESIDYDYLHLNWYDMKSYHNTNKETGDTLIKSEQKAKSQEKKIVNFFKSKSPVLNYSPEEILDSVFYNSVPITSVRRALTNLSNSGVLQKTNHMTEGNYGKMVHTWQMKSSQLDMLADLFSHFDIITKDYENRMKK